LIIFLPLFLFFFISSTLYFWYKKKKFSPTLFILLLLILIISSFTDYFFIFFIFTFPYIILFIAHYPIPKLNKLGRFGDFSYGLYIFAWPIQQTILVFINDIAIGMYIILCYIFTFPVAYISWHFIESKALSHKKDIPNIRLIKEKLFQIFKQSI
jgi:peptidoglycan/LPS O-acetylase OafA/YrhL